MFACDASVTHVCGDSLFAWFSGCNVNVNITGLSRLYCRAFACDASVTHVYGDSLFPWFSGCNVNVNIVCVCVCVCVLSLIHI